MSRYQSPAHRSFDRPCFDTLEARELLSIAAGSDSFGTGGYALIQHDLNPDPRFTDMKVTPTADGRLVATDSFSAYFYRGDGSVDPKRGTADKGRTLTQSAQGTLLTIATAVDPKSGNIAVLRRRPGVGLDVNLYDAKGKYVGYVIATGLHAEGPNSANLITFAPNGDILVAGTDLSIEGSGSGRIEHHLGVVYRYTSALKPAVILNGSGKLTFEIQNLHGADEDPLSARLYSVTSDPEGGIRVVASYRELQTSGQGAPFYSGRVIARHFTPTGFVDENFGGPSTFARVLVYFDHSPTGFPDVADVVAAADGTIYTVVKSGPTTDTTATKQSVKLIRTAPDGTTKIVDVVTDILAGRSLGTPSVAVSPDGRVYVSTSDGGWVTQLYTFINDGDGFHIDDAASNFGDYTTTTSTVSNAQISADAKGRVYLMGITQTARQFHQDYGIFATNGSSEGFENAAGSARLSGDGTLVLKGRATADVIVIRTKKTDVLVEFNGRKLLYDQRMVRGLYVQGGNGNDRIEIVGSRLPLYAEGGAGSDTIIGSALNDTLIGGSSNDSIIGNDGDDDLYGQDGNDTLLSGLGLDRIYGGKGNDTIDTTRINATTPATDSMTDFVSSGSGSDTIKLDQLLNDATKDDEYLPLEAGDVLTRAS